MGKRPQTSKICLYRDIIVSFTSKTDVNTLSRHRYSPFHSVILGHVWFISCFVSKQHKTLVLQNKSCCRFACHTEPWMRHIMRFPTDPLPDLCLVMKFGGVWTIHESAASKLGSKFWLDLPLYCVSFCHNSSYEHIWNSIAHYHLISKYTSLIMLALIMFLFWRLAQYKSAPVSPDTENIVVIMLRIIHWQLCKWTS